MRKILTTRSAEKGKVRLTFTLDGHPEAPEITLSPDDFSTGQKMKEAVVEWAARHGGGKF